MGKALLITHPPPTSFTTWSKKKYMLLGCKGILKILEQKDNPLNQLISDTGVCRTAPATLGLIITGIPANLIIKLDKLVPLVTNPPPTSSTTLSSTMQNKDKIYPGQRKKKINPSFT